MLEFEETGVAARIQFGLNGSLAMMSVNARTGTDHHGFQTTSCQSQ